MEHKIIDIRKYLDLWISHILRHVWGCFLRHETSSFVWFDPNIVIWLPCIVCIRVRTALMFTYAVRPQSPVEFLPMMRERWLQSCQPSGRNGAHKNSRAIVGVCGGALSSRASSRVCVPCDNSLDVTVRWWALCGLVNENWHHYLWLGRGQYKYQRSASVGTDRFQEIAHCLY